VPFDIMMLHNVIRYLFYLLKNHLLLLFLLMRQMVTL